jgi:hypothetical protein
MNRRELLKLTPVIALGAFAIPKLQLPLLKAGLGFSDWASARLFRSAHLAHICKFRPYSSRKFPHQ